MRNKYKAHPVVIDGIRFASTREGNRYLELKLLEKVREIEHLELQPSYELIVNGTKIGTYRADFRYFENGEIVTEDCKGYPTSIYKLKKKLMRAIHGIDIRET